MKNIETLTMEDVVYIIKLINAGWEFHGDDSWIHPDGKKYISKNFKGEIIYDDYWPYSEAINEIL